MTAVTPHVTRSPSEVAALRAAARDAYGQSAYRAAVSEAVTATLDWLEGHTGNGPATGEPATPHGDDLARERAVALDAEARAHRSGVDGTRPGVIAQTIDWWRCDPLTEPPLL